MFTAAVLAALIAGASAAPTSLVARQSFNVGTYVSYNGDGTTGQGWPSSDQWAQFEDMWSANSALMQASCSYMGVDNTSSDEASQLKDAINSVGQSAGVDPRVILAMVMQESKGCVRIWGTKSPDGVYNPGLLQDHAGTHTCNDGVSAVGNVQTPCPADQINGMIADGVTGTGAGVSLKELGGDSTDSSKIYLMARKYNSGPNFAGGDLATGGATPAYASDVANRLMGVVFDKSTFQQGAAGSGPASAPASGTSAAPAAPAGNGQSGQTCKTVAQGDTCWSLAGKAIDGVDCQALQVGQQVCW